jgi:hypothetical protein
MSNLINNNKIEDNFITDFVICNLPLGVEILRLNFDFIKT